MRAQSNGYWVSASACFANTCSILAIAFCNSVSSLPSRSFFSGFSTLARSCSYFRRLFLSSVISFTFSRSFVSLSSSSCRLVSLVGFTCLSCVISADSCSRLLSLLMIVSNNPMFWETRLVYLSVVRFVLSNFRWRCTSVYQVFSYFSIFANIFASRVYHSRSEASLSSFSLNSFYLSSFSLSVFNERLSSPSFFYKSFDFDLSFYSSERSLFTDSNPFSSLSDFNRSERCRSLSISWSLRPNSEISAFFILISE